MTPLLACFSSILVLALLSVVTGSLYKDVHNSLTGDEWERTFGEAFHGYDYDIIHPVQVDASGDFLSHDFSNGNGRRKREIRSTIKEPLFLKLSAFGQDYHLNVTINDQLFSPNFAIEVRNNRSSSITFEVDHCHYVGQLMSVKNQATKVAISNCDGLRGMIHTPDDSLMVTPLPDRLGLHKNKSKAHIVYRRSVTSFDSLHASLKREKRSDHWCGVEDELNSRSKRETSTSKRSVHSSNTRREYTVESLVVADKKMVEFHGLEQIKTYVPSQINMVQQLIGDSSIGARIKFVIHKLLILEHDQEGLVISSHAANTLNSFCSWAKGQNIEDDSNPEHFDHAALISRYDFCRNKHHIKGQDCEKVLGLARVEGMCSVADSCTLNKDTGLGTSFTIAHETGHNLGANHDGAGNQCQNTANVMGTTASGQSTAFEWSECSRHAIQTYLSGDLAECLGDKAVQVVELPKSLPGQLYDANDQCRRHIGDGTRLCPAPQLMAKICYQLWCQKRDHSCITNFEPAAEGTKCDEGKWCRRGMCVTYGSEGPEAIDGQYGPWSDWGECSQTCAGGARKRERMCNNPAPKFGGRLCEGPANEFEMCKTPNCPEDAISPRMSQCQTKNEVEFIDGMTYEWAYNPGIPTTESSICKLQCTAEVGPRQFVKFAFGDVKDGTLCNEYDENSGVCLDGKCTTLGCDNVIGSEDVFDRCGVCNGDGTSCVAKRFTYKGTPVPFEGHYQEIGIIPKGVRNIQIKELSGFKNFLALMTTAGKDLINMDFKIRPRRYVFVGAGTKFTYTRDPNMNEKITAPGPLKEAIQVLYLVQSWRNEYIVRYRYLVARPPQEEASFALRQVEAIRFVWESKLSGCSVTCGGGFETATSVCVREQDDTRVSDHFCVGRKRDDMQRPCNPHKCPASWRVGEWTDCSKTCNAGQPGTRTREVTCSVTSGGIEAEVGDETCVGQKPETREKCALEACRAEWVTTDSGPCSTSCGKGTRSVLIACRRTNLDGETEMVSGKYCKGTKPPSQASCNVETPCDQ